ncbi:MAG: right-handed parallel beta-helix repeat-containing protein [bacterium]
MIKDWLSKGMVVVIIAMAVSFIGCGGEMSEPAAKEGKSVDLKNDFRLRTLSKASKNYLYGDITKDTVLTADKSPYYVIKKLTVKPEVLLTIKPGVEIRFDSYTPFVVEGNLHAIGTRKKRIVFTCSGKQGDWDGIKIVDSAYDYNSDELIEGHGCIIEYATISKARTGIACISSNPVIRHNIIKNNDEGVRCWEKSQALVTNNKFINNKTAIDCMNYSSPNITYNSILGADGKGIRCLNYCSPLIDHNTIFGSGRTWWKGLVFISSSHPIVSSNNIYANGGYNVYLAKRKPGDKSPDIDAKGNWWGLVDKEVIAKMIFDKMDKTVLGMVEYNPYKKKKIIDAKANW